MSGAAPCLDSALARARQALAQRDHAAARQAFEQAHRHAPDDAAVRLDLAAACLAGGDAARALLHARAAAPFGGSWRAALIQAYACERLQQADAAAECFEQALADPALPAASRLDALRRLAALQLNAFGDARGAAHSLGTAALLLGGDGLQAELAALVADLYTGGCDPRALGEGFRQLAIRLAPPVPPPPSRVRPRRAKRRIGLLSAQFCASPVGFLTLGALTALASQAELVFFDRGAKEDWARARFQALARHWLSCAALDSAQLQRLLVEAELDAVIDLAGWTDPVALRALAGRPVARQLKWVGGQSLTTGLESFDGFITDERQVPPAAAALYAEPLLYARHGYVSYVAPPYAPDLAAAAACPPAVREPAPGVVALVSNPAKISAATAERLRRLRPRRLVLVDQRWRHARTRAAAAQRLGGLLEGAEFVTPANHPEYLQALRELDATFVDTEPYAMGLTAVELRLLGKAVATAPRPEAALMCERHCVAHLAAPRLDHHAELAAQLLQWCGQ